MRGPVRGTETLLYVEDDQNVRSLTSMVLKGNGYTVIAADDGEEALRVAAPHLDTLAIVVTDVVMPRMGGRELAARLAALRPELPVLFMSGYTEEPAHREAGQS
jgi:CheY-like chemotaxis protein